ncbi:MAG: Hsp20/alpha crystallin family protein, partial [Chloroflexi bacterium]|nr:Hsp20/alpha crystallin family protein [Chloroflexota bacterium]
KPENVDITVTGNTLTIKGEMKVEEETERGNVHFRERRYGSFHRSLMLPTEVNPDKAEATFENGVLKLKLPKTEEARPKQIEVKAQQGKQQIQAQGKQ